MSDVGPKVPERETGYSMDCAKYLATSKLRIFLGSVLYLVEILNVVKTFFKQLRSMSLVMMDSTRCTGVCKGLTLIHALGE